jgi:hypothetical protein
MARQPLGGLCRLIFRGFTITLFRHPTLGRTPLDEGPARRRDLYLTTHNTHKRQTPISPVEFEPAIAESELPQTHALDRAATGIGDIVYVTGEISCQQHTVDRSNLSDVKIAINTVANCVVRDSIQRL